MSTDYLPHREADLLVYSNNFSNGISGTNATPLGLTAGQSTNFASLNTLWANSLAALQSATTKTPAAVITKDQCKTAMISDLRTLAGIIQKNPVVTDQQRAALGLTVRSGPTPIPPPSSPPKITVRSAIGRTITIALSDADTSNRRSKPAGVLGAQLFSYVGTTPPTEVDAWTFQGNCRRPIVKVTLANSVPNGAQVFFTGCWFNERMQTGPNTTPISCFIPGGSVSSAA